jgi:hypothetical protein
MTTSQWERLLENAGTWVGSFTQISPEGSIVADVPSVVALKPLDRGNAMRQEIHKHPPDGDPTTRVLEYRSLNKSILFFEGGAFSQGSIQWGPFSEFGAELGLMAGTERLRLVQLFDKNSHLSQFTLIREHLEGTTPTPRPPLSVEQLLGTWRGEAVTLYPDLSPHDTYPTALTVERTETGVRQTLSYGDSPAMTSAGRLVGGRLLFEAKPPTMQVLMLPNGASATSPVTITPRQALFLEAGWLITPTLRQRMIRRYNAQGGWASLTLVTEEKQ